MLDSIYYMIRQLEYFESSLCVKKLRHCHYEDNVITDVI